MKAEAACCNRICGDAPVKDMPGEDGPAKSVYVRVAPTSPRKLSCATEIGFNAVELTMIPPVGNRLEIWFAKTALLPLIHWAASVPAAAVLQLLPPSQFTAPDVG